MLTTDKEKSTLRVLLTALLLTVVATTLPAEAPDAGTGTEANAETEGLVLVFGASGRSGRYIIKQLAARLAP